MKKENDLSKRLFDFAVRVIKLLRTLPNNTEYKVIRHQLVKCSTSSGANYEESEELKNILGSITTKTRTH